MKKETYTIFTMFPHFIDLNKSQVNFEKHLEKFKQFHQEKSRETDRSISPTPAPALTSSTLDRSASLNPENPEELCVMIRNTFVAEMVGKPMFTIVSRELIISCFDKFLKSKNLIISPESDLIQLDDFLKRCLGFYIEHKATIRKQDLVKIFINKG